MSTKPLIYRILAAFLAIAVLSGCNIFAGGTEPTATVASTQPPASSETAAAPSATLAPTVDQNLANTQAAQTAAANQTLNAPTATTLPPTNTSTDTPAAATSTSTAAPTLPPTLTPVPPTAFPTATLFPWTLTPSSTANGYNCSVTSTTPKSSDSVKVSTNFDWSWVIKNTGVKTWGQHAADVKYVSGTAMQTNGNVYDLPSDVVGGSSVTVTIPMKSPSTAGTYKATWQIVQEGSLVCSMDVSVRVTN